ncbi:hypothetical protein MFLAVUS_008978 [Mucor flavus]|uniref:Uncharacterized protein n=1 Tax=Mucor flavus TaxID=439312 RepID=A0ABP9Z8M6_9FUNG
MDRVYNLHQHTHCVFMHIGKVFVPTSILPTLRRNYNPDFIAVAGIGSSISYNRDRTEVNDFGKDCDEEAEDNVLIDNFCDGLYSLFKKDKKAWDDEDKFLMKAVSDYLPRAIKKAMRETKLNIESFDLFHYAFIVPSEWEEEMREDIIRPIFVQSGLISNEDHKDRLLFFSDIESLCYGLKAKNGQTYSFERGQNTILCRLSPDEKKVVVKFDLIQTTSALFNFPNSKLFPKIMKSSSVSVTKGEIKGPIKEFLRTTLFPVVIDDSAVRKSLKSKLIPVDKYQLIEDVMEYINSWDINSSKKESEEEESKEEESEEEESEEEESEREESEKEESEEKESKEEKSWKLTFFGDMKDIISNNSSKSYEFLLLTDSYSNRGGEYDEMIPWLTYILECNRRSLNCITTINKIKPKENYINPDLLLYGASKGVFEAVQHSDIYCNPRIVSSGDLNTSSSVFLNSKPDAIVNLDISLGSTLFTYSLLNEDGSIQQIFNNDGQVVNLPPLGHFYTFSKMTTLNVKERFILFAEKYFLGDLVDFTVDDSVFMKDEIKAILTEHLSTGEVLVSTNNLKYIKAFILMYMVYIKEEILNKLPDHSLYDRSDTKIGGLVPKDNNTKKLRITAQGERVLPAIQKSLGLEFTLRSYFLLCQLHEDYVQLSLHQVVTASTSEEKEQESIIVQDEIVAIPNIYDSLCESMWRNLVQDSSLIELCEMHNTSDKSKIFGLFSSNIKTEFFANLKVHISDNVLQNNPGAQSKSGTYAVKLNNSCNCKVHLATADVIDISFTPVLQDIACTLSGSLLNKELFGNYMNIDYLFSFIRFSSNPQLQYAFARILEEEADDFNLELGIDTCCLLVPKLFNQLIRPVIAQRPFCYKDFKTGALQQVCSGNYVFGVMSYLMGGKQTFYLRSNDDLSSIIFTTTISKFESMNYLEDNETLNCGDNIYQHFGEVTLDFKKKFKNQNQDAPVMISVSYNSYTSSFMFLIKTVGVDNSDRCLTYLMEAIN